MVYHSIFIFITCNTLIGLDLVRRDWCKLSKDTGKTILDFILSGQPKEEIVTSIHAHMTELASKVRKGGYKVEDYVITKGLHKNPKDYPNAKNQPHLQVALRMLANNKPVNIGKVVLYSVLSRVFIPPNYMP